MLIEFKEGSLEAIAKRAIERKTGARGLRAILEEIMLDIMYDIPSSNNIEKVIITPECILEGAKPEIVYNENRMPLRKSKKVPHKPDQRLA